MDLFLMENQLRDALQNVILRVAPEDPENASRLSEILADGLTRYLIYARRASGPREEDFGLMMESLEFWAGLHGYSKSAQPFRFGLVNRTGIEASSVPGESVVPEIPVRKPVQKQAGRSTRVLAAATGQ